MVTTSASTSSRCGSRPSCGNWQRAISSRPDHLIRAALFDLGGVILSSPFDSFARYERENGLDAGFIRGLNAADHLTNAWARLERNEVTLDEFAVLFEEEARAAGGSLDGHAVIALLAGDIRPEMVEAVRRCH